MIKRIFLTWEVPIILKILKYGNLNVEDGIMMHKYMGGRSKDFYKKIFLTKKCLILEKLASFHLKIK